LLGRNGELTELRKPSKIHSCERSRHLGVYCVLPDNASSYWKNGFRNISYLKFHK